MAQPDRPDRHGYAPLSQSVGPGAPRNAENALQLLLEAPAEDVVWVLSRVEWARPGLLIKGATAALAADSPAARSAALNGTPPPGWEKLAGTEGRPFARELSRQELELSAKQAAAARQAAPASRAEDAQIVEPEVAVSPRGRELQVAAAPGSRQRPHSHGHGHGSHGKHGRVKRNKPEDDAEDNDPHALRFPGTASGAFIGTHWVCGHRYGDKALTATHYRSSTASTPTVQFSTRVYYCSEDEATMKIDIIRIGYDLAKPSKVGLRTIDISAKAGAAYQPVDTEIYFAPWEDTQSISIPLIDNDLWDTTTEFAVELHAMNGKLVNAELSRHLWQAHVKLMDNDIFPSNRYRAEIQSGHVNEVPKFRLFIEYLKFNWRNPIINERSIKHMLIDQLHNVYGFIHLFVNVYLVDFVLSAHSSNERLWFTKDKESSLLLIVAFILVPFVLLHYLDHLRHHKYGVGGNSRIKLQCALLRKFLNYDEAARLRQRNGDLIMAVCRDVPMVVGNGYINVLVIAREFGQLCFMFIYQFVAPVVFHKKFSFLGFFPLVGFPLILMMFLSFRNDLTSTLLNTRDDMHDNVVRCCDETVSNYRLIADYDHREKFVKHFEDTLKAFNGANRNCGVVLGNNEYFAKWLGVLIVASFTLVGGLNVVEGRTSLGMFLASIHIFTKIGLAWAGIYKVALEIETMFPALENIIIAMNLATDVPRRKVLNRRRRELATAMRKQLRQEHGQGSGELPMDRMPIRAGNLNFTYCTKGPAGGERITKLNQKGVLDVRQGQLVCLVGPQGGGKATLLKIIGGAALPSGSGRATMNLGGAPSEVCPLGDGGELFVPPHLRMLHVSGPLFFEGTLLANLTFGVFAGDEDQRVERVVGICHMLGVSEDVLKHVTDNSAHVWCDVFSDTQCWLLCIARALIASPEVLCIHKPTKVFDEGGTKRVTRVLKDFVQYKGLMQNGPEASRRPRTCIITSSDTENLYLADHVFHVSRERGIRMIHREAAIRALDGLSEIAEADGSSKLLRARSADLRPATAMGQIRDRSRDRSPQTADRMPRDGEMNGMDDGHLEGVGLDGDYAQGRGPTRGMRRDRSYTDRHGNPQQQNPHRHRAHTVGDDRREDRRRGPSQDPRDRRPPDPRRTPEARQRSPRPAEAGTSAAGGGQGQGYESNPPPGFFEHTGPGPPPMHSQYQTGPGGFPAAGHEARLWGGYEMRTWGPYPMPGPGQEADVPGYGFPGGAPPGHYDDLGSSNPYVSQEGDYGGPAGAGWGNSGAAGGNAGPGGPRMRR